MLWRFFLYGFLKNQQYYDPFLFLSFMEKGLTCAWVGLLVGFREVCVNGLEMPTGAVADVLGRRRSMVTSVLGYIGSFVLLGLTQPVALLFLAMLCFAVGEAFRTGTHKAIIFDGLEQEGRSSEKTSVCGYTRSWSKLGSAISVIVGVCLCLFFRPTRMRFSFA